MDRFFVITGGPGSGNTGLIAALDRHPSSSPKPAAPSSRKNRPPAEALCPWKDPLAFAQKMLARDIAAWDAARTVGRTGDLSIAASRMCWAICNGAAFAAPRASRAGRGRERRYNRRAFLAPPWPEIFTQDAERKQTLAEALRSQGPAVSCGRSMPALAMSWWSCRWRPVAERAAFVRAAIAAV